MNRCNEVAKSGHILRKCGQVTYKTNYGKKPAGVIEWTDGKIVKITDSGNTVCKNGEDVIAVDDPASILFDL